MRVLQGDSDRPWQFEIYNVDESRDKDMVKGCKLDKTGTVVMGNHRVYRREMECFENNDFLSSSGNRELGESIPIGNKINL